VLDIRADLCYHNKKQPEDTPVLSFLEMFYKKIGIPAEYLPAMLSHAQLLNAVPEWHALVKKINTGDYSESKDFLVPASEIGAGLGIHTYTAQFSVFAFAAKELLEQYRAKGIAEEIYWDSMRDLLWKFRECLDVHGVPGSFVAPWFAGFYRMNRFALGRLQFEHAAFREEEYSRCGLTLHKGDDVINVHIPSSGPLTKESRLDAYRRAYEFYKGEFPTKIMPIVCSSWLLYPAHREFLPEKSNILSFMEDFDIISFSEKQEFSDAWRVFGSHAAKDPSEWPRDTSLRRAYAERVCAGKPVGGGYGVILFDGEKIL